MRWIWAGLAWACAQSFQVRFLLEARQEAPFQLVLRTGERMLDLKGHLLSGKATAELSVPSSLTSPAEALLFVPGYLPLRLAEPVQVEEGVILDFAQPQLLHRECGYVEKEGRAYMAAGELGSLPGEPYPVINAYDYELFLRALATQDSLADFNGDARVDVEDQKIILKNQSLLLHTNL
ncbi:MAG: hypothetical protein N2170_02975 [Bacteroidia bacterium]|nr:hypothetical protein [Bacteroidia bacterium]